MFSIRGASGACTEKRWDGYGRQLPGPETQLAGTGSEHETKMARGPTR